MDLLNQVEEMIQQDPQNAKQLNMLAGKLAEFSPADENETSGQQNEGVDSD